MAIFSEAVWTCAINLMVLELHRCGEKRDVLPLSRLTQFVCDKSLSQSVSAVHDCLCSFILFGTICEDKFAIQHLPLLCNG